MKRGLKYLGVIFAAVLLLTVAVPSVFSETAFAKSKSNTSTESGSDENTGTEASGEKTKETSGETPEENGGEKSDDTTGKTSGDATAETSEETNGEKSDDTTGKASGETTEETIGEDSGATAGEQENNSAEVKKEKLYTKSDLRYLSAIIFCEANNHTMTGMIAVANVVINRRNDTRTNGWGHVNTIKDVIYDRKWGVQFTPAYASVNSMKSALSIYDNLASYEGTWRYTAMKNAKKAAKAALTGTKVVPDNYYYFNGHIQSSKTKCYEKGWEYMIISGHIYY